MSENKVNGPEDAVVSELIKQLSSENIYTTTKCFQKRFHGSGGSAKFVEDCETGLLEERKPDAEPKKGISYKGHCADIGDVEVVRVLYCSSSGKRERT